MLVYRCNVKVCSRRVSDASGNLSFTKVKDTHISLHDLKSDVSVQWFTYDMNNLLIMMMIIITINNIIIIINLLIIH